MVLDSEAEEERGRIFQNMHVREYVGIKKTSGSLADRSQLIKF